MGQFKQMSAAQLSKIQSLEKEFGGKRIIAYENAPKFAQISPKELDEVRSAEKEMDATLVVYAEK
ncbi:hypothetical protein [Dehalogenimonas etheniformans]|uniref:Uncharacterized protein n=1 Tax=Dehalogenimonas etheniformans TaxID=1536648 RepID=A0A2P5P600_9CHLR|nr:hypothetical protein [Dehalogenimonas etheniformans]PPD57724.1 hypothetical protein JP09_008265 [Dehalogenimonas etheniformans]QNT76064.1 hypothetical protein HX448_04840 [Dehalogenimonas etheniformans]